MTLVWLNYRIVRS